METNGDKYETTWRQIETNLGQKCRPIGDQMEPKMETRTETNGDKNGDKWSQELRQIGDKLETNGDKLETRMETNGDQLYCIVLFINLPVFYLL